MTQHVHVVAFLAPIEDAEACNRAANALGRSGENFSVRLSASGSEPASHLGGSANETGAFLAVLSAAPNLPEGMAWPEALAAEDWKAVADHLMIASGPANSTNAGLQFAELIAAHGLVRIEQADSP